jgi:hypothetical protein
MRQTSLALLWLLAGCSRSSELVLRDTEGRTFAATCEPSGACKLTRKTGKSLREDQSELALYMPGRVVGICDVAAGAAPTLPSDCRPLSCQGDDDCPPGHGLARGHCLSGICIEPANAVAVADAVMLCLAGTGLGRESASQVERFALAQNCGNPCVIPRPCRQL